MPDEERIMNFEDIINQWVEEVEVKTEDILQTSTYLIGKEVVTLSPVDTGLFKGNWQLTIGAPTDHSLVRYDKDGTQVLSDMSRVVRTFTPGQIAYIQNTVEYGYDLEYGSSNQAPDGMVRITEAKFQMIVDQAIRLHS